MRAGINQRELRMIVIEEAIFMALLNLKSGKDHEGICNIFKAGGKEFGENQVKAMCQKYGFVPSAKFLGELVHDFVTIVESTARKVDREMQCDIVPRTL